MRVGVLLLLVSCWREPAQRSEPELSFVARVHLLGDLREHTDTLVPRMYVEMQRILGLASEAERAAIREDLNGLEIEVRQLSLIAKDARERGERRDVLDEIDRKLDQAKLGLVNLRDDLLHAKTRAEQEAFEELKKKVEGTLDHDEIRMRLYRRNPATPPETPLLPPLNP
jgi:hypothetical protein